MRKCFIPKGEIDRNRSEGSIQPHTVFVLRTKTLGRGLAGPFAVVPFAAAPSFAFFSNVLVLRAARVK